MSSHVGRTASSSAANPGRRASWGRKTGAGVFKGGSGSETTTSSSSATASKPGAASSTASGTTNNMKNTVSGSWGAWWGKQQAKDAKLRENPMYKWWRRRIIFKWFIAVNIGCCWATLHPEHSFIGTWVAEYLEAGPWEDGGIVDHVVAWRFFSDPQVARGSSTPQKMITNSSTDTTSSSAGTTSPQLSNYEPYYGWQGQLRDYKVKVQLEEHAAMKAKSHVTTTTTEKSVDGA